MIRSWFFLIAFLNIVDGILSYWGYVNGYMKELNPFMAAVLSMHPLTFLLLKLWVSAILVGVGVLSKTAVLSLKPGVKMGFLVILWLIALLYTLITLSHLRWLVPVLQVLWFS